MSLTFKLMGFSIIPTGHSGFMCNLLWKKDQGKIWHFGEEMMV